MPQQATIGPAPMEGHDKNWIRKVRYAGRDYSGGIVG